MPVVKGETLIEIFNAMKEGEDIFAQIAVQRYQARVKHLVESEPIQVPKRTLPLDKTQGSSSFKPIIKLSTQAGLCLELSKLRESMAGFLADLAPPLESSRLTLSLEEFDWREVT